MSASGFSSSARQACGPADLGDGRGERARQERARGDGHLDVGLTCRNQVDQVVVGQQRRAGQHRQGDLRLIGRQSVNNNPRRVLLGGKHLGKRPPHQR